MSSIRIDNNWNYPKILFHIWLILFHIWLIRKELQFEFFSFNTFNVPQIFCQCIVQTRPKYSYWIFLKELCWVSVCWIMNNALCSISLVFSGFCCVPHCAISLQLVLCLDHHMICRLSQILFPVLFHITEGQTCWHWTSYLYLPICTAYINHCVASVCILHLLFIEGFKYHRQNILLSPLFVIYIRYMY